MNKHRKNHTLLAEGEYNSLLASFKDWSVAQFEV